MKEVAERLRSLRESVKLSQVKMAEIVGVKQSSLNRYELNQASPTFETLNRYADYFDVSMDYIFGRTDNPQGCMSTSLKFSRTTPRCRSLWKCVLTPHLL